MARGNVAPVSTPAVEYSHLPGEEQNPLMESTLHADWIAIFTIAGKHTVARSNDLVTGNLAIDLGDGGPRPAPDVMVIPDGAGKEFGCYRVGVDGGMPKVCIEIVSPSNSRATILRRSRRFVELGIPEVYVLHPVRETIMAMEVVDGELVETPAIGRYSPGLNMTFARRDGQLALCCVGGRLVRAGDDIGGWIEEEQARADRAEFRAETEAARAETEAARAAEALRAADSARAEAEAARAELAELRRRLQHDRDAPSD